MGWPVGVPVGFALCKTVNNGEVTWGAADEAETPVNADTPLEAAAAKLADRVPPLLTAVVSAEVTDVKAAAGFELPACCVVAVSVKVTATPLCCRTRRVSSAAISDSSATRREAWLLSPEHTA